MAKKLTPLRDYLTRENITLDRLADQLKRAGVKPRPSKAKLSRIASDVQEPPFDLILPLSRVTGLSLEQVAPKLTPILNAARAAA